MIWMCEIIGECELWRDKKNKVIRDKSLLMYVNMEEHTLSFKIVFNVNKNEKSELAPVDMNFKSMFTFVRLFSIQFNRIGAQ